MCGIGGILFSTDGEDVLQKKMARLNGLQRHRGPDGQSEKIFPAHALCHQRLALLDAAGGLQPFADASGRYYIVYNGELYNYKELREELAASYSFRSSGDTEVVLASYLVWGEACLDRFNGMWAFLIWDSWTESGFAARDPLGVKPFVYYYQSPTLLFASEVKAILPLLDTRPEPDEYALAEYLIAPSLSGGGPTALLKGIRYLEPGTYFRINRRGLEVHRYYSFNWEGGEAVHTGRDGDDAREMVSREEVLREAVSREDVLREDELSALVGAALEESVRLSLRADVPVGIFLSGGLDSSLIAAIASRYAGYAPTAYTIQFEGHEGIHFDPATIVNSDDLPFAKELAKLLGLPFREVPATPASLEETLRQLAVINDRVPAWEQEFSQHSLARSAAADLKTVLVGDAADETHYGYFFLLNEQANSSPLGLINMFGGEKRKLLLHPDLRRRLKPMQWLDERYRDLALEAGHCFGKGPSGNILAMSTLVYRRWLERLLHNGDIHTMNFGLEARVPFANRSVLEAACRVDPAMGFKNNVEKNIVRRAAGKWLPPSFAGRKKSTLPRDPRLGKAYQSILYGLLQDKNEFVAANLNKEALLALCEQEEIPENDRMILFTVICLIYWAERYAK